MAPTLNAWLCLLLTSCLEPLGVSLVFHGDAQLPPNKSATAPTKLLMRSAKRGKWATKYHARTAPLGKALTGGHLAPHDASHSLADGINIHEGQSQNSDCDTDEFTKPEIEYWGNQPESMWWRVRMYQPCQMHDVLEITWHITNLKFYSDACDDLDGSKDIHVDDLWVSGSKAVRNNKQLTRDHDSETYWEGVADDDGQLWIAARLNTSEKVRCVKFTQCLCDHSARWVVLEFSRDYTPDQWTAVPLEENSTVIDWGKASMLSVKKVRETPPYVDTMKLFAIRSLEGLGVVALLVVVFLPLYYHVKLLK